MSYTDRKAGRLYAVKILQSVDGTPRCMFDDRGGLINVVCNLEETAATLPAAYAEGILAVTKAVREALKKKTPPKRGR